MLKKRNSESKYSIKKEQQIYANQKEEPNNQLSGSLSLHSLAHKLDLRRNQLSHAMHHCHNLPEVVIHMISQTQKLGYRFFDQTFVEKCIIMFEELMGRDSRMITSEVLEDATRLAVEWKDVIEVSPRNTLLLLGFLEFVAAFKLAASFNKAQILKLFKDIADYKLAPKIFQELGFVDELSDLVVSLIKRGQYIAATRFACSFQTIENDVPVSSLLILETLNRKKSICSSEHKNKTSLEESGEDKDIAALYAVLDCIADYKLESEISAQPIVEFIVENTKDSEFRFFKI